MPDSKNVIKSNDIMKSTASLKAGLISILKSSASPNKILERIQKLLLLKKCILLNQILLKLSKERKNTAIPPKRDTDFLCIVCGEFLKFLLHLVEMVLLIKINAKPMQKDNGKMSII